VGTFVVVEIQGAGDRVDHRLGSVGRLPLLQTRVVRRRDTCELCQLFAPEAGDAAGTVRGDTGAITADVALCLVTALVIGLFLRTRPAGKQVTA
jgi:hypothetical protein